MMPLGRFCSRKLGQLLWSIYYSSILGEKWRFLESQCFGQFVCMNS
jgi:hypothetical protein